MANSAISAPAVQELQSSFAGQLVREEDEGYEQARKVWNGYFDRRPALVARCASVEDVCAAVRFGTQNALPLAVRGGGHSAQGYGSWDEALVIDLSPMKEIDVDPATRTARAQGGVTWGEFDQATQAHGLAVTGGRFSSTGIAG